MTVVAGVAEILQVVVLSPVLLTWKPIIPDETGSKCWSKLGHAEVNRNSAKNPSNSARQLSGRLIHKMLLNWQKTSNKEREYL